MGYVIKLLTLTEIDSFLFHLDRHLAESGQGETPIFSPYEPGVPWKAFEKKPLILERWSKELHEPGWERAWGVFDGEKIVGHLDLRTGGLEASLHRVVLGMGVECDFRKNGLGKLLLTTAIDWAKEQPSLYWIDLNVFSHNKAAYSLYQSLGFEKVSETEDLFRVAGSRIDDIHMVMRLR